MTERVGEGARGETPSYFLGRRTERQKKKKKYGMALNARRTMNIHNIQPKTGGRNGGDNGGEVQQAGHAGEAQYHRFEGFVSQRRGRKIK